MKNNGVIRIKRKYLEEKFDVISDYVIDLGTEGGKKGGNILFQGTPEDLCNVSESHTARFLTKELNQIFVE